MCPTTLAVVFHEMVQSWKQQLDLIQYSSIHDLPSGALILVLMTLGNFNDILGSMALLFLLLFASSLSFFVALAEKQKRAFTAGVR